MNEIKFLHKNQVPTPSAGLWYLFYDLDNGSVLTAKDSDCEFHIVGDMPALDTTKIDDCICEVLSDTTKKLSCAVEKGVIQPDQLESYINNFNLYSNVTYDPVTGSYSHGMTSSPTLFVQLTLTNVLCNGGTTGTAAASVQGGVAPYTIDFTDMAGAPVDNANLAAGAYKVTVADNNGVTKVITFIITEPPALALNVAITLPDEATALPSGGTAPYTYEWKDNGGVPIGQTTQTATGLASGTYQVEVTDANGCTIEDTNVVIP
jgi:hypothetical protein